MARGHGSWAGADPEMAPTPISKRLDPGEHLIWWSSGGAWRVLAHSIGLPMAAAVGLAFWLWAPHTDNPWLRGFEEIFIGVWCAIAAWFGLRGLFETLIDIYVLTDRRVMVIRRLWPSVTYSLAAPGVKGAIPIRSLRVTGTKAKGDISLRGFGLRGAPAKLFGVDQPIVIAEHIRQTLGLAVYITDRTA